MGLVPLLLHDWPSLAETGLPPGRVAALATRRAQTTFLSDGAHARKDAARRVVILAEGSRGLASVRGPTLVILQFARIAPFVDISP